MPYRNMPENLWPQMERCVAKVQAQGQSKESAIAICYSSLMGKSAGLPDEIVEAAVKATLAAGFMIDDDQPAVKVGQRNSAGDLDRLRKIKELSREIAKLAIENGAADDPVEEAQLTAIAEAAVETIQMAGQMAGETANELDEDEEEMSGKGLNLSYVKSLHRDIDPDALAVKAIGGDTIKGYLVVWGDADKVDVENEFFTRETDFWDKSLSTPRPLTWDHQQDPSHKAHAVIGEITEMGDDDIGRWYVAQLDRNSKYRKAINKLIAARAVGTSSDSAPQYVQRERTKSGATWLRQWPLFAAALTPNPAEPRMLDTVYWKSINLELPEGQQQTDAPDGAAPDGAAVSVASAVADVASDDAAGQIERLRLLAETLKL